MTREQVLGGVRATPTDKHFVWDGVNEDERPLTKEEMLSGIVAMTKNAADQSALAPRSR